MLIPQTTAFCTTIATLLILSACADGNTPLASKSCTDLARDIGMATQFQDDAVVDSIAGTLDMLAADNKADEITGGIESLVGDVGVTVAQSELDRLNRAFRLRGCR